MRTLAPQVLDAFPTTAQLGQGDRAAILLRRASALPDADRHLLTLALHGQSVRDIAAITGKHPGSISRRVRTLSARLSDPLVALLIDSPIGLPPQYREVGLRHYLRKQSRSEIGRELELPVRSITAILAYLAEWPKILPRKLRP